MKAKSHKWIDRESEMSVSEFVNDLRAFNSQLLIKLDFCELLYIFCYDELWVMMDGSHHKLIFFVILCVSCLDVKNVSNIYVAFRIKKHTIGIFISPRECRKSNKNVKSSIDIRSRIKITVIWCAKYTRRRSFAKHKNIIKITQ